MTKDAGRSHADEATLDGIVQGLQRLRKEAGDVSFAEIAARIAHRRASEGLPPAAARIARSTVFDAFQSGRHRLNAELVREIALALGENTERAASWRRRCLAARTAPIILPPSNTDRQLNSAPILDANDPGTARTLRLTFVMTVLIGCVGMNFFGGAFVARMQIPLFLDMAGTATASFVLGPWWGALVGLTTNTLGVFTTEPAGLPFALVNISGALVWGYGMRYFARTIPRYVLLNIVTALVCTVVAVPIYVLMYDGITGHGSDVFIALRRVSDGVLPAVFSVNFLVSLVDKQISGFIALALARAVVPLRPTRQAHDNMSTLLQPKKRPVKEDASDVAHKRSAAQFN